MTVPIKFKISPILDKVIKSIIWHIKHPPVWVPGFGTVRETYALFFFFLFLIALSVLKHSEYGATILPNWFFLGCRHACK